MPDFAAVARLIDEAREARAFPACTIEVGRCREVLWQWATGRLTYDTSAPQTTLETIFDLASLTKVIATTPLTMALVSSRQLLLNSPIAAYVPEWRHHDRRDATVLDLLEHCTGLPSWADLYHQ